MEQQATRTTDGAPKRELLQMEHISKSFPGVKALDNVSLTVKAGTVHALMGENGAGKSTLMKCLFGIYNKDDGKIFLDGKELFRVRTGVRVVTDKDGRVLSLIGVEGGDVRMTKNGHTMFEGELTKDGAVQPMSAP